MITDILKNYARKKAIKTLLKEVDKYREELSKNDRETFINLFNTGVHVDLKTLAGHVLNLTYKTLEKQGRKTSSTKV